MAAAAEGPIAAVRASIATMKACGTGAGDGPAILTKFMYIRRWFLTKTLPSPWVGLTIGG